MTHNANLFAITAIALACSCSPKVVERVVTEYRTEYRDSIVWRDTTIYVNIPDEHSTNHLQLADTSHLETSLAVSTAWVDSTGLHHFLGNKRGEWGVRLPYPTRTIIAKAETSSSSAIERKVYVEKPLTSWQRFRLNAFWWLLAALVLALAWIFRKPLLALLKRIL